MLAFFALCDRAFGSEFCGAVSERQDEEDIHLCDERIAPLYEAAYAAMGIDFNLPAGSSVKDASVSC